METATWVSAHYEEPFHSRRIAKLPEKLDKLGLLDLDPSASVLDACCGKGEALALLRRHGFKHLAGADGFPHAEWQQLTGCHLVTCDVRQMPFVDGEFDAIVNLHALHHMGDARGVTAFLEECFRVLRPGGKLFVLDFPGSPQIRLLFWSLRERLGAVTPGLRNFARIVDEEWPYLSTYLRDWPSTQLRVRSGPFQIVRWRREFFLYYLILSKPPKG